MRRLHPEVTLRLREYVTEDELRERMARGIADLAVGFRPGEWQGPVREVGEEEVGLVVPADDPLCGTGTVRLEQLADRGWVRCGMEPWVEGRPFLDHVCARAGFVPRTAVRVEHSTTAARMAAAGAGLSMVSSHLAPALVPEAQLLSVGPPWLRPLTAFSRSPLSGAAAEFVRLLAEGEAQGEAQGGAESGPPVGSGSHRVGPYEEGDG